MPRLGLGNKPGLVVGAVGKGQLPWHRGTALLSFVGLVPWYCHGAGEPWGAVGPQGSDGSLLGAGSRVLYEAP